MQVGPQGLSVTESLGSRGFSWVKLQMSGHGEEPGLPATWPQPKAHRAEGYRGDRGGGRVSDTLPNQADRTVPLAAGLRRAPAAPAAMSSPREGSVPPPCSRAESVQPLWGAQGEPEDSLSPWRE